ncbi:MAG: AAA family ATPase [Streptosporangiaceae bacterium]
MSISVVSPVLVGRLAELDVLDAVYATARTGTPRAVLVGGEAGVGKTRLVREFCGRADGARVLVGGCLELGVEGLPFAPFTAVLRQLIRELGLDGVTSLVGGKASGLSRLLPEFGDLDGRNSSPGEAQARLFELVLTLLEKLAADSPLLLVIEDAHWADRSTRDLLAFLLRNLSAGTSLMIVVTYRSDELHRAHPLRPLLAELERLDRVQRQELSRLTRREVAELMAKLRGVDPAPGQVDQFYRRSEGNPLFVEALMDADGTIFCDLPESLRDLLLAGVQRLPEETQEILRVASAGGARLEHRLLETVTGVADPQLSRDLRPAVAANVLAVDGDGYAFRHALIREAVHDDLLPGEHTRLHTRYAEALEIDASLVTAGRASAELAHHWYSAHNLEGALISAWRASRDAEKASAYPEELRMLERILELWDQVPDAGSRIGEEYARVLELAVCAADWAGDSERGIKLANAALKEIHEPVRRAHLLVTRGRMKHRTGRIDWSADMRTAIQLIPAEPPTSDRSRVLASFAQYLFMGVGSEEARVAADEALSSARLIGDVQAEAGALVTLVCMDGGRYDDLDRLGQLDRAQRLAESAGLDQILLRVAVNRSHILEGAGRHTESVEVARKAIQQARDVGLFRTQGSFLAINLGESLYSLGRWADALPVLEQALEADPPRPHVSNLSQVHGDVLLAQGDVAGAARSLAVCRALNTWQFDQRLQEMIPIFRLEAELALTEGDHDRALAALAPILVEHDRPDESRYVWPAMIVAARAARTAAELQPYVDRAVKLECYGPLQHAQRRTFEAESARVMRTPADWDAAIAGWETSGQPYPLAQALLRAAECDAQAGRRDQAAARAARALDLARSLGAALAAEALDFARRLGRGSPSHGLTTREVEVLKQLALGRSNKEIAEDLFISAKTASVHVSNILAKLGVASRGEAAAAARALTA